MTNILSTNPNKKFPRKTAAIALIAASALSLTGCSKPSGAYVECVGSQSYTVKPHDTLNQILLERTVGVTEGTVNDISAQLGQTYEFKGPGELPRLEVTHWAEGTPKPSVNADDTVDIPLQCSN